MIKEKDIKVNISLKYKNDELNKYVRSILITNSVDHRYTNIILNLNMEFGEYAIKHNLRGKELLNLTIQTKDPSGKELDQNKFYLIILESNISLITEPIKFKEDTKPTHTFQNIILHTVPINAIKVLATDINYIHTKSTKSPLEALKIMLEDHGIDYNVDLRYMNKTKVEQLCVPPMSLNKTISFLNDQYGLYKGPYFFYATNEGKIQLWCLEPKIKDKIVALIYQYYISENAEDKVLKELREKENKFPKEMSYLTTKEPIRVLKLANLSVLQNSFKHVHIEHPREKLYNVDSTDINKIINETNIKGKIYKDNLHNRLLNDLTKYHILNSGENTDINADVSAIQNVKYISSAPVLVTIKGFYRIKHLFLVGYPIELKSFVLKYKQFSGKYILYNSDVTITKRDDSNKWYMESKLELTRYA